MPSNGYTALYSAQNSFLSWLAKQGTPFYLTGGTALSRFYLHHRYSDDLDFFANQYNHFLQAVQALIQNMPAAFSIDRDNLLISADFCRFFIRSKESNHKIEFVNDVAFRVGESHKTALGLIDNPANILANKLTALVGRDEPKDVFDIITLSGTYAFTWPSAIHWAKQKAAINELEVESRLSSFPMAYLKDVSWLKQPMDLNLLEMQRQQICDDLLTARVNSLGEGKPPIEQAQIVN